MTENKNNKIWVFSLQRLARIFIFQHRPYLFHRISNHKENPPKSFMDAPLHRHATLPDGSVAGDQAVMIPPETSSSGATDGPQPTSTRKNNNKKKKKKNQTFASDNASLDSSSNCSSTASYSQKGIKVSRNPKVIRVGRRARLTDADALGLPLGMSIAAVVAQVDNNTVFSLFVLYVA